jgi:cholera toxin transcriptional activator
MAQKQINEHLIFDDISRDLISLKLENKKVTLGQAAAFCLDCLIAAQGNVVSQETLIEEGWRKHGFEVSSGSVRQVVCQLRRAFDQLKESPALLLTVHKLGYRLHVELPKISTEQAEMVPTEVEQKTVSEQSELPDCVITPVVQSTTNKKTVRYFFWAAILLLNAAFVIGYFYTQNSPLISQVYYGEQR